MFENGAQSIIQAVQSRDPSSVVSSIYTDFSAFVAARRADNETFKAFEYRLEVIVSRVTAHGSYTSVPELLLALILLNGTRVDDNQRVIILAVSVTTMPEQSSSVFAVTKS